MDTKNLWQASDDLPVSLIFGRVTGKHFVLNTSCQQLDYAECMISIWNIL